MQGLVMHTFRGKIVSTYTAELFKNKEKTPDGNWIDVYTSTDGEVFLASCGICKTGKIGTKYLQLNSIK